MIVRALDDNHKGYALCTWREGAKKAPGFDRVPFSYFKDVYGRAFKQILDDPAARLLGAYTNDALVGWLAMSPGKRVHTVHWVHTKFELDGERLRRRGIMTALLDAAELGSRFIYTCRAQRVKRSGGSTIKSLDEALVLALRAKGVSATYVSLKEWSK